MVACMNHENKTIRYDSDYVLCDDCLLNTDFEIRELKSETIQRIEESDFSDLVQAVYKRPYRLQQSSELGQYEYLTLEVEELSQFDDETLAEVDREINEWVNSKLPKLEGRALELWWQRENAPDLEALVIDLTIRGHLKPGEYILTVWW